MSKERTDWNKARRTIITVVITGRTILIKSITKKDKRNSKEDNE